MSIANAIRAAATTWPKGERTWDSSVERDVVRAFLMPDDAQGSVTDSRTFMLLVAEALDERDALAQRCKVSEDCLPEAPYRDNLSRLHGDLLSLLGSSQAAASECLAWLDTNKARLHTADCSYHEPSARCSCGLHRVLSYTRAIANGSAPLFIAPSEPVNGCPAAKDAT